MESIGRLAAAWPTIFNNLLGVILGYTELALENATRCNRCMRTVEIQKAAQRSADLTRNCWRFPQADHRAQVCD